jgi:hypothetical protein
MISPAVHFAPVPLPQGGANCLHKSSAATTSGLEFFLPSESTLQASGFLTDKLISEKAKTQQEFQSWDNGGGGRSRPLSIATASVVSTESENVSGATTPRSAVTTPRDGPREGGSVRPFGAASKPPLAGSPVPKDRAAQASAAMQSQAAPVADAAPPAGEFDDMFAAFGNKPSAVPAAASVPPPKAPAGAGAGAFAATGAATGAGADDDVFAAFGKPPAVAGISSASSKTASGTWPGPGATSGSFAATAAGAGAGAGAAESVISDVRVVMEDSLTCVCKHGKIDKFDYVGKLTIALGNDSFQKGLVKVHVHDAGNNVADCTVHPTVVSKAAAGAGAGAEDSASFLPASMKVLEMLLPANRKPVAAVRIAYLPSFRPQLFQARTSVTWKDSIATVVVRVVVHASFRQHLVENFLVSLNLAALCVPGAAEPAAIKGCKLTPNGAYSSGSSVATWSSAKFSPVKNAQISMQAVVDCRPVTAAAAAAAAAAGDAAADTAPVPADAPAAATQQLPVLLRGKYSTALVSGLDYDIDSVVYKPKAGGSSVCRDFDFRKVEKLRLSKFEYRFT